MKKIGLVFLVLTIGLSLFYGLKTYDLKTITQAHLPPQGAWAELSQGNLYYRWYVPPAELRNGETLVLVHGFSTPHFVWDGVKHFLIESGYDVLVYDHFGRGLSERPSVNYDQTLYVESLRELLAHQQVSQPVHLVGYSMGGAVAGYFAQAYPKAVKTLSLIAPAGFMTDDSVLGSLASLPIVGEWLGHMFANKIVVNDIYEAEMADIDDPLAIGKSDYVTRVSKQLRYRGFVESLVSTLRHFNLFNAHSAFLAVSESAIPTLAIWGTNDATVPYVGSASMLKVMPQAELVTVLEGGHNITYMQPSIVGPAITSFLQKQLQL